MKNKKTGQYAVFKKKLFIKLIIVFAISTLGIFFVRSLISGKAGEFISKLLGIWLHLDESNAQRVYFYAIGNLTEPLMAIVILLALLISLTVFAKHFIRYFNEIADKLDELKENGDGEIKLSPELGYLENKFIKLQQRQERHRHKALLDEQKKNDLVIYSAHDIKTPMTSIMGYLILLDNNPDLPQEDRKKYIGIALKKTQELNSMINELFEITRYNLHDVTLNQTEIDLFSMLDQMKAEHYPELCNGDKLMEISGDENVFVSADAEKLARAFNNLMKNAVLYSDRGSTISVQLQRDNDKAVIIFKNKCRPLPEEKLKRIFDQFYRAETTQAGSGLGLAISKEIVLLHNGSICAENYEEGIEFIVKLPAIY